MYLQSQHIFLYFSCNLTVSSKEITCYQSKKKKKMKLYKHRIISSFLFAKYFPFYGFRISLFGEISHSSRRNKRDFAIALNHTRQDENFNQQNSSCKACWKYCFRSCIREENKCVTGRALLQLLCSYREHHSSPLQKQSAKISVNNSFWTVFQHENQCLCS